MLSLHALGRGFQRNRSLWASFALNTPKTSIYVGGDSGYGEYFLEIGEKYGSFDLAILGNGQYDKNGKYIHMMPGEQLKAVNDLKANVHSGKFTLGNHDWDEPFLKITENQDKHDLRFFNSHDRRTSKPR